MAADVGGADRRVSQVGSEVLMPPSALAWRFAGSKGGADVVSKGGGIDRPGRPLLLVEPGAPKRLHSASNDADHPEGPPVARIPFRAKARTVDHLGREQIADGPTAVSELWKNAYDAYARNAELHIFPGKIPVAALVDDGHGMSEAEFIEKWLMLGTDSKAGDDEVPEADRNGLPPRPRQGQKGIGRLSVAYLGPTVLVLTKRMSGPVVAALIDWRLFQNPYLTLDDVRIPIEALTDLTRMDDVVAGLFDGLVDNVWGGPNDAERHQRLEKASSVIV